MSIRVRLVPGYTDAPKLVHRCAVSFPRRLLAALIHDAPLLLTFLASWLAAEAASNLLL